VRPSGPRAFRVGYRWSVDGEVQGDYDCSVLFIAPPKARAAGFFKPPPGAEREPEFSDGYRLAPSIGTWQAGETIEIAPREIAIPEGLGARGKWELWTCLKNMQGRAGLRTGEDRNLLYRLGTVRLEEGRIGFERAPWSLSSPRVFTRADEGWAAGMEATDRLIKNTWEVLTWLDRLTADIPMSGHAFLRGDRSVERSHFDEVEITVNYGDQPFEVDGSVLPRYGFLVRSPGYVAFHALRHAGIEYPGGALFTLRSLDGETLERSSRVRVYHGFGPSAIALNGKRFDVAREAEVSAR
jgi:hypothetical protein